MARYHREVTLHRFVHAEDAEAAVALARDGLRFSEEFPAGIRCTVVSAAVASARTERYLHAGEGDDLWRVLITVWAVLDVDSPRSASEACYQLVAIDPAAAACDAFECEITVHGTGSALPHAS